MKHYALLRHGVVQKHLFGVFTEEQLAQGLEDFLRPMLEIDSEFIFKYDKDGAKRAACEEMRARGDWQGVYKVVRSCAFGVHDEAVEVTVGYHPDRLAQDLEHFRDGLLNPLPSAGMPELFLGQNAAEETDEEE